MRTRNGHHRPEGQFFIWFLLNIVVPRFPFMSTYTLHSLCFFFRYPLISSLNYYQLSLYPSLYHSLSIFPLTFICSPSTHIPVAPFFPLLNLNHPLVCHLPPSLPCPPGGLLHSELRKLCKSVLWMATG